MSYSYKNYQWNNLRHRELYNIYNYEDLPLLIESEKKHVRYVLYFVIDLLNKCSAANCETKDLLLSFARKYFITISADILNPILYELIKKKLEELDPVARDILDEVVDEPVEVTGA
ncbi:hypothetical protein [Archaeoglobus veneficus]|uniref:Uncharacterized protein n=2 Tax=root TaxID=1 RepID=F2KMF0_ARCVS|nr:hypothetical protein [Archaeoglobus veneficus]AEA46049.1 hypothetical protein Arcve_0005 [Archaeoglobus veneficus SNP6]